MVDAAREMEEAAASPAESTPKYDVGVVGWGVGVVGWDVGEMWGVGVVGWDVGESQE